MARQIPVAIYRIGDSTKLLYLSRAARSSPGEVSMVYLVNVPSPAAATGDSIQQRHVDPQVRNGVLRARTAGGEIMAPISPLRPGHWGRLPMKPLRLDDFTFVHHPDHGGLISVQLA